MKNSFYRSMFVLLTVVILFTGRGFAETFEFLTYSPPAGWTYQNLRDGVAYRRPAGIGLITFYPSYPATGSPADEFTKMWKERVEPAIPGAMPQSQVQNVDDYAVAAGRKEIDIQGQKAILALVTLVGRGRTIGVLTMAGGDDALREIGAFLATLETSTDKSGGTANGGGTAPVGGIEVDFEAPPGYISKREGPMVVLTPATVDDKTPCAYGISPARASAGTLEASARAALPEILPDWQIKGDRFNAMRGTSGDGWPYFWFRTDVQKLVGGSYQYAAAMTMAFPAGPGRVNIVWGVGNLAHCTLDDLSFVRLFHSLRPRGWTPDGGKALLRDLQGIWRNTESMGIAQYKFLGGGRYEFGIGTVTQLGVLERTSSSVADGRYELRGPELTITPDRRDRRAAKYRVRVYEEFHLGRWTRAMSLLDESGNPALEVQYMRIEDSR